MNINEVYQGGGDYLKAADIVGKGLVPVTIATVGLKEFDDNGKTEKKLLLSFQGKDKELVVNKTNANIIAETLGPDTDNWPGGKIKLYAARVEFSGKIVDAIRVELAQGNITGEAPPPEHNPGDTTDLENDPF